MTTLIDQLAEGHALSAGQFEQLIAHWHKVDANHLSSMARLKTQSFYGKDIYMRGLIEISNVCKNDCYYCGIRRSNREVVRYRMHKEDILSCCAQGYELGFRSFVLQGGEDSYFTDELLCDIVKSVKQSCPDCAITLSLGEKARESYAAYKAAGADRYLLRHETADACHYAKLHPGELTLASRLQCLYDLKSLGYQTGAGFMVGSPYQSAATLAGDMIFLSKLKPQMVGIGPFIPHHQTPFARENSGSVEITLFMLSLVRLLLPGVMLPATTALGTVAEDGWERGILAGANVIMLNLTPPNERAKYQLYDNKNGTSAKELGDVRERMRRIGYNTAMVRGDFTNKPCH